MEIKNNPAFSQATQNTSKGKQTEQASTQGSNHSGTQASSSSRADSVTFTSDALRLHALVRDAHRESFSSRYYSASIAFGSPLRKAVLK